MKLIVDNTAEKEPVEMLAKEIQTLSAGMKRLMAGPLSERAIIVLLQDATKLPKKTLQAAIQGIIDLEDWCVKDQEEGEE